MAKARKRTSKSRKRKFKIGQHALHHPTAGRAIGALGARRRRKGTGRKTSAAKLVKRHGRTAADKKRYSSYLTAKRALIRQYFG